MRAIRPETTGGPEVMTLREYPTPEPGPGEVRVRVLAAGVNFIDIYRRSGQYKVDLPIAMGSEGAGEIEAVAPVTMESQAAPNPGLPRSPDVTGFKVGDRVAWAAGAGSYATHVVIAADKLVPVPAGVDPVIAAAAMLQGMTAHYLACSTYPLKAGDECLIHAAAGGVGLLLCQLAKRAGARVIGTVSTEDKAKLAKEAGADEVILYTKADFQAETRRLTGGRGVHVVYDSIGKDTFAKSLGSLRRRGMLVLFGQSSGAVSPIDPQILAHGGSLFLTRPTLGDYTATREDLLARAGEVLGLIQRGELSVKIGATFPLADAAEAHRKLAGRETVGKVLLIP